MSLPSRHQQPPRPWAKGSRPIAASPALVKNFHYEDCALHCSTISHCYTRVDGPVRLLVVEPSHACFAVRSLCLAGTFPRGPWNLRSSSCKAPRSVLETTSTSSRHPALQVDIQPNQSLLHCSLNLLFVASLELIPRLLLVRVCAA